MDKNYIVEIKLFITALFAGVTAWLGIAAVPIYILVALNIIDYWTGITAAKYRGEERSSDKGFRGLVKKFCMLLMVGVAGLMDWLISSVGVTIGLTLPFAFPLAAAIAVWLICNEVISILENFADIGVEHPKFLLKWIEWVKYTVEDKSGREDKENVN